MQKIDTNRLYRRTLFTDYRSANNIAAEAFEAGYEDKIVHAMIFRAGIIEAFEHCKKIRRENAELRRENERLFKQLTEAQAESGVINEIIEVVRNIGNEHAEEVEPQ